MLSLLNVSTSASVSAITATIKLECCHKFVVLQFYKKKMKRKTFSKTFFERTHNFLHFLQPERNVIEENCKPSDGKYSERAKH